MLKILLAFLLCASSIQTLKNGIGYVHHEALLLSNMEGTLKTTDFDTFKKAKVLVLAISKIDHIEDGGFCGAPFAEIKLAKNRFPRLKSSMFANCSYLEKLVFEENDGLVMDTDVFSNLNNLKTLIISGQPIEKLTKKNLQNLTSLEQLYLYDVGLEKIDAGTFDGLQNLRELFLAQGKIRNFDGLVSNLPKLEQLGLMNNTLENIPLMENVSKLTMLDLDGNKILKLDVDRLRNLPKSTRINIKNNPISCTIVKTVAEEEQYIIKGDHCGP